MIIDLCSPRKKLINKALNTKDDILLNIKLHPKRYQRIVFVSSVALIVILSSYGIKADDIVNTKEELVNYYINELHYPREAAEKIINSMRENDIRELYTNANNWNHFYNRWQPIGEPLGKALKGIVKSMFR